MWLLSVWPFAQINLGIFLEEGKVEEEEWEEKEKKKEERLNMGVVVGFGARR